MSNIYDRRAALVGQRYTVAFYGGWYVIDEHTGRTIDADSIDHAVSLAERKNGGA